MSKPYDVGYKKPPKSTQFKKGKSGKSSCGCINKFDTPRRGGGKSYGSSSSKDKGKSAKGGKKGGVDPNAIAAAVKAALSATSSSSQAREIMPGLP